MSQHPSLKVDSAGKKHRNVLKRYERIRKLQEDEKWDAEKDSVYGLPKVKSQKVKTKGGKSAKTEEEKASEAQRAEGAETEQA